MQTDVKTYRFNFHATIGQFILNAPNINSPIAATWKRSSQSTSTTTVDMVGGKANFNQTITLPVNMYLEMGKQIFQDKKTIFTFTMSTPKGQKQAGVVYVEVAKILNNKLKNIDDNFPLQKCPIKDSKVHLTIVAELIGEGAMSDQMSIDSSVLMNASGPSTLSIQSKRDIPSASQIKKQMKTQKSEVSNVNSSEIQEKNRIIAGLESQVKKLAKQKQDLVKQLQKSQSSPSQKQSTILKQQMLKSKSIQQKLQTQLNNLRTQNIEHERQLQKMRMKMQQIYQLLFNNLNSLY